MLPDIHCTQLHLRKGDVVFLPDIIWIMSAKGVLVEAEHSLQGRGIWDMGYKFYDTSVPIVFLESRCRDLCNAVLRTLHAEADLLPAGRKRLRAAVKPDDYQGMIFVEFNTFVLSTFLGNIGVEG